MSICGRVVGRMATHMGARCNNVAGRYGVAVASRSVHLFMQAAGASIGHRTPAGAAVGAVRLFSAGTLAAEPEQGSGNALTPEYLEMERQIGQLNREIRDCYREGRYADGLSLALDCKDAVAKHLGRTHIVYGSALNNVGLMQKSLGQYDDAVNTYTEALQVYIDQAGEEFVSTSAVMYNLAWLYKEQAETAKGMQKVTMLDHAREYADTALKLRRKLLNDDHPSIPASLIICASVRRMQGGTANITEAEKYLVEAVERAKATKAGKTEVHATALNSLAFFYKQRGRFVDAEAIYKKALALRLELSGLQNPQTIIVQNNLAECYLAMGQVDKARGLQEGILSANEPQPNK